MIASSEFELNNCPKEGISSVWYEYSVLCIVWILIQSFTPDKSSYNLLATGWDKVQYSSTTTFSTIFKTNTQSLRLYNTANNSLLFHIETSSPLLDCCFSDKDNFFCGGIDGTIGFIYMFILGTIHLLQRGQVVYLNMRMGLAVWSIVMIFVCHMRCFINKLCSLSGDALYTNHIDAIISGSWDKTIMFYDIRSWKPVSHQKVRDKVFSMSTVG